MPYQLGKGEIAAEAIWRILNICFKPSENSESFYRGAHQDRRDTAIGRKNKETGKFTVDNVLARM
jgi:hypothetical protein